MVHPASDLDRSPSLLVCPWGSSPPSTLVEKLVTTTYSLLFKHVTFTSILLSPSVTVGTTMSLSKPISALSLSQTPVTQPVTKAPGTNVSNVINLTKAPAKGISLSFFYLSLHVIYICFVGQSTSTSTTVTSTSVYTVPPNPAIVPGGVPQSAPPVLLPVKHDEDDPFSVVCLSAPLYFPTPLSFLFHPTHTIIFSLCLVFRSLLKKSPMLKLLLPSLFLPPVYLEKKEQPLLLVSLTVQELWLRYIRFFRFLSFSCSFLTPFSQASPKKSRYYSAQDAANVARVLASLGSRRPVLNVPADHEPSSWMFDDSLWHFAISDIPPNCSANYFWQYVTSAELPMPTDIIAHKDGCTFVLNCEEDYVAYMAHGWTCGRNSCGPSHNPHLTQSIFYRCSFGGVYANLEAVPAVLKAWLLTKEIEVTTVATSASGGMVTAWFHSLNDLRAILFLKENAGKVILSNVQGAPGNIALVPSHYYVEVSDPCATKFTVANVPLRMREISLHAAICSECEKNGINGNDILTTGIAFEKGVRKVICIVITPQAASFLRTYGCAIGRVKLSFTDFLYVSCSLFYARSRFFTRFPLFTPFSLARSFFLTPFFSCLAKQVRSMYLGFVPSVVFCNPFFNNCNPNTHCSCCSSLFICFYFSFMPLSSFSLFPLLLALTFYVLLLSLFSFQSCSTWFFSCTSGNNDSPKNSSSSYSPPSSVLSPSHNNNSVPAFNSSVSSGDKNDGNDDDDNNNNNHRTNNIAPSHYSHAPIRKHPKGKKRPLIDDNESSGDEVFIPSSSSEYLNTTSSSSFFSNSAVDNNVVNDDLATPSLDLTPPSDSLAIASFNARGNFFKHLSPILNMLLTLKIDVLLVQDAGFPKSVFELNQGGFDVFKYDSPPSDKASVLLFVIVRPLSNFFSLSPINSDKLPFKLSHRILHGSFLYPFKFDIINMYVKHGKPEEFEEVKNLPSLLIGGDLNSFLIPHLDTLSSKAVPYKKPRPLQSLIHNGLIDVFRYFYPDKRLFTRVGFRTDPTSGTTHITASRIDYMLSSHDLINKISSISVKNLNYLDFSDHKLVLLKLHGKKLPISVLLDSYLIRKNISCSEIWREKFKNSTASLTKSVFPHWNELEISSSMDVDFVADEISNVIRSSLNDTFPLEIVSKKPNSINLKLKKDIEYSILASKKNLVNDTSKAIYATFMSNHNASLSDDNIIAINKINLDICTEDKHKIDVTAILPHILQQLESTKNYLNKHMHKIYLRKKSKMVSKAVRYVLENIELHPEKAFNLFNRKAKSKVDYITKFNINKNSIDILTGSHMIKEIESNWKNTFSQKVPPANLDKFLAHMPVITGDVIQPDFSVSNLMSIIKNKHNSAPGPSSCTWKCLKNVDTSVLEVLSQLFSYIYINGYVPESWKEGNTVLLEKPTSDLGLDRFRPITLLSVEYKLYSHALNEAFVKNLTKYNLIPPSQNGFFPNRGSDQCLHALISIIADANFKCFPLYCLFIDFAKAFDSVEHWVIEKLFKHCNFASLGNAILGTLFGSFTKINTTAGKTDNIFFERGTKQGDILSPSIFIFLLAPLLWFLNNSKWGYPIMNVYIAALALADDISLISFDLQQIQSTYYATVEYADLVGLSIKPSKSAAAYKGAVGFIPEVNGIKFCDLGSSKSYKYLGVHINLDLNWDDQRASSELCIKNTLDIVLRRFYLPIPLHVKIINAIIMASVSYRMQFILFGESWLSSMQSYIVNKLCSAHSVRGIPSIHFWCNFMGLINLNFLNRAVYISNVHKNLNKPNLIAFPPLNFVFSKFLNPVNPPTAVSIHPFVNDVKLILSNLKLDLANSIALRQAYNLYSAKTLNLTDIAFKLQVNLSPETLAPVFPPSIPAPIILPTTLVHAFTDGSVIHNENKMRGGVFFPCINFTHTFPVNGVLCSMEPELQSIEVCVKLCSALHKVVIFTDSITSINAILNFNSLGTNQQLKIPCRATIRRIVDFIEKKNLIVSKSWPALPNSNITFYHIHSHLLTNQAKRFKHYDTHKIALGPLCDDVIFSNNVVDKAVNKDVSLSSTNNVSIVSCGIDAWQLAYKDNLKPIFSSVRKFLYNTELNKSITTLKATKPAFSSRLFNPLVNFEETTYLLRKAVPSNKNTATFLYRLLEKSLPTKNRVHKSISSKSYFPPSNERKRQKLENTYANPFCHTCFLHFKLEVIEDTAHVFSTCPLAIDLLNKAANNILAIYNKFASPSASSTFPFWFSNSLPKHVPICADEVSLMNFPPLLGNVGYVPIALKSWFKSKSKIIKFWKKAMREVTLALLTCIHERWNSRCSMLFNYGR